MAAAGDPAQRGVWDDHSWSVLSARLIELAGDAGALSVLPAALTSGAAAQLLAGQPGQAAWLLRQAEAVARADGRGAGPSRPLHAGRLGRPGQ